MRKSSLLTILLIGALCVASALLPLAALAQTVAATPAPVPVIQIGSVWQSTLLPIIESILGALVTAFLGWAAVKFTAKTGVEIEAKHREALHSAAMTGVHLALTKVGGSISAMTIGTKSQIIADAATWVLRAVPDAIAHLGMTPEAIGAMVESKLNAILIGNASAAATPSSAG